VEKGMAGEFNIFSPEFFYYHLVIVTGFGLLFGSFLNVCIYRIPAGISIVTPGSHCFSCGSPIRWYDNIPLLSYVILRGGCRFCGASFSPRYFFIELLTGVMFGYTFYRFGYTLATPVYIVFLCLLIIASFTDIDHWIIPDGVSLGGTVFALAAAIVAGFFPKGFILSGAWPMTSKAYYAPFVNAAAGALAGAVLLYAIGLIGTLIFRKEAMGFGDVKLFLLIGAVLGALNSVYVLMVGSIIGSVVGGILLIAGKLAKKTAPLARHVEGEAPPVTDTLQMNRENPEEEKSTEPLDIEERVLRKILQGKESQGTETDNSPPPSVHHIPFGPFLALAAAIILLWGGLFEQLLVKWMYGR
jgi:leader peptidase (prepilin peptidase)/N-methyltransferase